MSPTALYLLYLLAGLLTGALIAWLFSKYHHAAKLAVAEEKQKQLQTQLDKQLADFKQLQQQSQAQFENLANRIFEEKSSKFTAQNQAQIGELLKPLKERIKDFEENIDRKFLDDAKEKLSLKIAIDQLRTLNSQLSDDANRLALALKGDNKTQGDWGEYQLEMLLEKAGLEKGIHYRTQESFKDDNQKDKRPDFIINLPDDKHLVIDCKVSLVAYERFFNAEDKESQARFLKAHVESLRQHVKGLSEKQYQLLHQIQAPDYTLLFVPIEPAFALAQREDSRLFLDALDKNVVIVTSSTLLATMRTVSFIWKQEKQKQSVLEIARQSGMLYDKLVGFVEDLKAVGARLDAANDSYHNAMQKLMESRKYGDTLLGRAERIKKLGAKASKSLPSDMLPAPEEETGEDN
jgi:DNA recombination protein RmuC